MKSATIAKALRNKHLILGVATASSFASGSGVTYLLLRNKLARKYEIIAMGEIVEARKYYAKLNKAEGYSDPSELAKKYEEEKDEEDAVVDNYETLVGDLGYDGLQSAELRDEEPKSNNIWLNGAPMVPNSQYDPEIEQRDPSVPYVLTEEEFMEGELDHSQVSLTYYEEDDVLLGADEIPIEEIDATLGRHNLDRFGYGSNDNNLLYIRNERIQVDYEVIRTGASYAQMMMGSSELEHSDGRGKHPRKFRSDYE